MVLKMNVQNRKLSELTPYPGNAKKHDKKQIANVAESIRQYGFVQPIVVDRDDVIIIGHCRALAAKKLGMDEVPCVSMDDLTPEQVNALRLVDNKSNESDWDFDLLAEELPGLDLSAFDFDWGLRDELNHSVIEDDYDPVLPAEPKSKIGDVYQLGNHRLMCGDSTSVSDIDSLMDGEKASVSFTSPPYNIGKNAKLNDRKKDNKYIGYDDDNGNYKELLYSSTKIQIANSQYAFINIQMLAGNKDIFLEYLNDFKDYMCDIGIWYKDNVAPAMAHRVMNSSFEFVLVFSEENQSRAIGTRDFHGTVSNVYQSHIRSGNEYHDIHSATFPIGFVSHYIESFTKRGDSVLDVFGGTGTTLMACEQLGRRCYMMEIEPRYIDVIIDRWEKFTGEKAVLLHDD